MTHPVFSRRAVVALFLERQHLIRPRAHRLSPGRLTRFAEDVGGVQMDSINVLDRAHYLTVWSRFGPYDRARLDRLVYRRRLFLEYWAHAACLVPATMLPWWKRAMLDYRLRHTGWSNWLRRNTKLLALVTESIRANGPMGHGEMEERRRRRGSRGWWDWRPAQHAIHYLWMTGVLTVHSRRHFQKRFDLMERAVPAAPGIEAVSSERFIRWHLERSLHAMGAATELDLSRYLTYPRLPRAARRATLRAMVAEGVVSEIAVAGSSARWLALTRDLPALRRAGRRRRVSDGTTLLAPFDSLLWHRDRVSRVFGFDYRIEVYTPGPKRVHGYYTLPILHDGHLIGRLDAKAHRLARHLEIRHVHFERWVARGGAPPAGWGQVDRERALAGVAEAIASLAVFVGADRITLARVTPGALRGRLRRAITSSGRRSAPPSPPARES